MQKGKILMQHSHLFYTLTIKRNKEHLLNMAAIPKDSLFNKAD